MISYAYRFTSGSIEVRTPAVSVHTYKDHNYLAVAVPAELWHCKVAGSSQPVQLEERTSSCLATVVNSVL